MAWKSTEDQPVVAMASDDIKWAQWMRVARNFQLRVGLKDRRKETFDGFMREVCLLIIIGKRVINNYLRSMTGFQVC
jgi:hypothetical protein